MIKVKMNDIENGITQKLAGGVRNIPKCIL